MASSDYSIKAQKRTEAEDACLSGKCTQDNPPPSAKKQRLDLSIDKLIILLRKTGLSDASLGNMLRALHMSLPRDFFIIFLFAPKIICNITIAILVSIYILFIAYGGCFLSALEKKLLGDDFMVSDPALEMFKMRITSTNRKRISLHFYFMYMSVIFIVYYYRF